MSERIFSLTIDIYMYDGDKYFGRFPMNHLSQLIYKMPSTTKDILKPLPLVHATTLFNFRYILNSGMNITPQPDRIFNEDLSYFYYGKPVYIPKTNGISSFTADFPIYMILRGGCISTARRIFPFDSGAFETGIFENYVVRSSRVNDFELKFDDKTPSVNIDEVATKFIDVIFGSNKNYYFNQPLSVLNYDPINFELEMYLNLIKSKESGRFDERHASIEVQISSKIKLSSDNLLAIIAPQPIVNSDLFNTFIGDNPSVELIVFPVFRSDPAYYSSTAVNELGKLLLKNGYL